MTLIRVLIIIMFIIVIIIIVMLVRLQICLMSLYISMPYSNKVIFSGEQNMVFSNRVVI